MTTALSTAIALTATVADMVPTIKVLAIALPKRAGDDNVADRAIVFNVVDGYTTVATRGTTAVDMVVTADVTAPGTFAVNGRDLERTLSKMVGRRTRAVNEREIAFHVDVDRGTLAIDYDGITVSLPTINVPDTPDDAERIPFGQIDAADLRSVWTRISVACGTDDTLPMLTSINMRVMDDGTAVFAATDRFRLARAVTPFTAANHAQAPSRINFKSDMVKQMTTLLSDVDGPVTLEVSPIQESTGNQVHASPKVYVTAPGFTITADLFDGDFPNIDPLFPKTASVTVTVDAAQFQDRLSKIAPHAAITGTVNLAVATGSLTMQVGGGEGGHAKTTIPADTCNTEVDGDFDTAFNLGYLRDGLKALGDIDRVTFVMSQASRPALFFDTDAGDPVPTPEADNHAVLPARDTIYLLMPIRLPG